VPTLSLFVDAMQREVEPHGFSTMVASSGHDVAREISLLKGLRQRRIDGLVIASSSERSRTLLSAMRGAGFPIVLIDRRAPAEFDSVGVEHAQGVASAVAYLSELGHHRIAMLSGEAGLHPARDRLAGYRAGMLHAGLKVKDRWVRMTSFSPEAGYEQTRALLALKERPTAIIAGGSSLLPGVMLAAREAGLGVPDDLSVIAGADSDLARLSSPGVTAVCWPHDVLGRAAGRFLVQRLADPAVSRQSLTVRAELVVRGSCAPVANRAGLTS
jgi:LacI family transcriptional regulator